MTIKHLEDITLSDLMAEEFDVWITRNKKFGFDLDIENKEGDVIVHAKGIHHLAMDSYADMCRRFLYFYDKSQ
jgi:hypothetical protein